MKRFELQISLYIDAEDEASMWTNLYDSGLHHELNKMDGTGHYFAELVDHFDPRHVGKSELN